MSGTRGALGVDMQTQDRNYTECEAHQETKSNFSLQEENTLSVPLKNKVFLIWTLLCTVVCGSTEGKVRNYL